MTVEPPTRPVPNPGWYPDPWWVGSERYWDGAQWTTQARWSGVVPPLPPPPPLRRLRPPAFSVVLALTVAIVVGGRFLDVGLDRFVTSLTTFQIVQWVFYLVVYGGMLALVVWATRRFASGSLRDDLGWSFRWSDIGWGPVLFIVTRIAQVAVTAPLLAIPVLRHSTQEYSEVMRSQPTSVLATLVIIGVVVAPITEELLFRGAMLRSLLTRFGAPTSAVIQGVLFGCYHYAPSMGYYNVVLITANSVFGIIFGFVALRRRSLGTCIVAHALTNASALAFIIATR